MNYEKSCGAVVYTKSKQKIKFLLVKQKNGYYGFPKGHVEGEETEHETAKREIREETGLDVRFVDNFKECDEYDLPTKEETKKTVVYFLANFNRQRIRIQDKEIEAFALVELNEALKLLKFDRMKEIIIKANGMIHNL
ncbi:MAG: NUDIX domain-containing protein [Acholeplasmatales bacterium]|nr:NUDIX domain-containing protein [Acholeplasmatales bacterium]